MIKNFVECARNVISVKELLSKKFNMRTVWKTVKCTELKI